MLFFDFPQSGLIVRAAVCVFLPCVQMDVPTAHCAYHCQEFLPCARPPPYGYCPALAAIGAPHPYPCGGLVPACHPCTSRARLPIHAPGIGQCACDRDAEHVLVGGAHNEEGAPAGVPGHCANVVVAAGSVEEAAGVPPRPAGSVRDGEDAVPPTPVLRSDATDVRPPEEGNVNAVQARRGGFDSIRGAPEPGWRTEVDRVLAQILNRVGGVEDAVVNVGEGIANIVQELQGRVRHASQDGRVESRSTTVRIDGVGVNHGPSTQKDWQQCVSQSKVGDKSERGTPPRRNDAHQLPEAVADRSAELKRPIVVDLDSVSNGSADDIQTTDARKRTTEAIVNRVHSHPRLRVVPCARKLLGVPGNARNEGATAGEEHNPIPKLPRYKDPPGYNDARDFGVSDEPSCSPPALQPKTHGVSGHVCFRICFMCLPRGRLESKC